MKSNSSLLYSCLLIVGDFLALVAAFVAAYLIRGRFSDSPVAHPIAAAEYFQAFLLLLPFWVLIFGLMGLYANNIYDKRFREMGRLFVGSFIGVLFLTGYAYAVDTPLFPSKLVAVYGFVLAFVFLVTLRNLARSLRAYLYKYDIGVTNILIVGNTKVATELVESLSSTRISGYRIVGIVGSKTHTPERFPNIPVFDSFANAVKKIHSSDIHSIVQTELYAAGGSNNEILEFAQTKHIAYRFVPGNSELFVGNIAVELFRSQIPVIAVHQTALIGWGRIVKRLTDIIVGGLFFAATMPLMILVAAMSKLSDPRGKVFYKEQRLSRFGATINIYKFRSHKTKYSGLQPEAAFMKMGRPELIKLYRDGGDQISNDPRITRLGHFLRHTSLDELPQLFSAVKGDISLVGPRALQSYELEKHAKKDLILAVKSGITGLAQVSGRRDISFEERRKLDLYYVQNWSLWLDLVVIIKTIRVVFRRIGAK